MLNNLTNFYNLIRGRMLRTSTTVAPTDIIPLGVVNPNYGGGYAPSAITAEDLAIAFQPGTPTLQQVSDTGGLDNGSNIQQGNVERFGLTGISRVCSQGFEIQFVNGVEYYLTGTGGQIWQAISSNGSLPDQYYDEVQGFQRDSIYNDLKTRISYICISAATDNAVWLPMAGEYFPTLSDPNGAVLAVNLGKAYYSISNGIVDVTIYVSVDVDFSLTDNGLFKFTLPVDTIGDIIGSGSISSANQCNVAVYGTNVNVFSKDLTFIENGTKLAVNFKYQAY
jgi:hypothetical protein